MVDFRSWLSAFGNGISGIFLSFLGIGTISFLFYYYENFNSFTEYSYSWGGIIMAVFVIPIIILFIGSASFYYGIKIIQNNH